MHCDSCGTRRAGDDTFCSRCGARLPVVSHQQPAGPQPPSRRWLVGTAIAVVLLLIGGGAAAGTVLLTRRHHPARAAVTATADHPSATHRAAVASASPSATPDTSTTPSASPEQSQPPPSSSPTVRESSFPELYQDVHDGVIRLETTACDGGGVGSGFLLTPTLVATAAHVVGHAISVAVRDGTTTTSGTVVGYDADTDVALVRADRPLTGHVFDLAADQPPTGTDVAAIGYPLGGDQSFSSGSISGLGRDITVEGHPRHDMIQTSAPINPGNSGGPLLTLDGTVVGLVDATETDAQGISYAIPADRAAGELSSWRADPRRVQWVDDCDAPTGPDDVPADVVDRSGSPDGAAIAEAFTTRVEGINSGDYDSAYSVFSPAEQGRVPFEQFSQGNASSYITQLSVDDVTRQPDSDRVEVHFTSVQDPDLGGHDQECSAWAVTYRMVESDDGWHIDGADPHAGSPQAC